jgi:hypothetical protein
VGRSRTRIVVLGLSVVACLALAIGAPATALGSVVGPCTITATSTSGGPVDLATTDVWHIRSADQLSIVATSTVAMNDVTGKISAFGFDVPIGSATSSGDLNLSTDLVPASIAATVGRVFVLSGVSNGPNIGCSAQVEVVIDDASPFVSVLGIAGSVAALVGLLGFTSAVRNPAGRLKRGVAGIVVGGAGLGLVLQQTSTPGQGDPAWAATTWAAAVPSPATLPVDTTALAWAAGLTLAAIILMPFPSELFNRTLDSNAERIRARLARLPLIGRAAGPGPDSGRTPLGRRRVVIVGYLLVSALLYGLLDPAFGSDPRSALTYVSLLAAIAIVAWVAAAPARAIHRARAQDLGLLRVVPATLLVGAACVAISRLAGFEPGYLYGLLIGFIFARELAIADEGKAAASGVAWMLGLSVASWFALGAVRTPGIEPSPQAALAQTVFAAFVVGGIEGAVFGLVPMRFLHGGHVFRWSRLRWAILYGLGLLAFWLIILNPANGFLESAAHPAPFLTTLALFLAFGAASILFWAWFRFRPGPAGASGEEAVAPAAQAAAPAAESAAPGEASTQP